MNKSLSSLLAILLASCIPPATPPPGETLPGWNNRVFCEVFVRSFCDSNGNLKDGARVKLAREDRP